MNMKIGWMVGRGEHLRIMWKPLARRPSTFPYPTIEIEPGVWMHWGFREPYTVEAPEPQPR